MKNYCLLILCFCAFNLSAQTYEGEIGEYSIFLELDTNYSDGSVTAFYFYKQHLVHIQLDGTYSDTEITLFQQYSEKKDKKELFSLTLNGNSLNGTWQNGDKTLQVELTKTTQNLEAFKQGELTLLRDIVIPYGEKKLVWFTEKYSKKRLFRLGNGFTKEQRDFLNPKLDTIQQEYAMMGLECSWADVEVAVKFVSDEYISFEVVSSVYCGGAHPSHSSLGYTYDLKNLKKLTRITDFKSNVDCYQLLKNKYEGDSDLQEECEYFGGDEMMWEYCSWVLTEKGVMITPSFPHAMTPCEEGFLLSYEELK